MKSPNLRASTTKRARQQEVFDKMTTVRGVQRDAPSKLMQAMAATYQAGEAGRHAMDKISAKLQAINKASRLSHKK